MRFEQPSVEEDLQADVLTSMPTLITILDVDLIAGSATVPEKKSYQPTKVIWFPTGTNTASFTLDLIILNSRSNP